MSLWERLTRIFRSRRSASQVDVDSLDASYREQTQLLQHVRRGVADITTSRRRVELQISQLTLQKNELAEDAARAVATGDDQRARNALTREVGLESLIADLQTQHEALAADEQRLVDTAGKIETQIESFRARKDTLKARYTAAQARSQIQDAFTGVAAETSQVGQTMRVAEQRTRELEAKADAIDELVADGLMTNTTGDEASAFDRQLEALSAESEAESRLERLKSRQSIADGSDG